MLLVQMVVFASVVPLLMRLKPARLQSVLDWGCRAAGAPAGVEAHILRHFNLARRMVLPLVRSHCLTRGITLYYFLRRAGVDVSLSFGMARIDGRFLGHCWLTRTGLPYLETPDPRPLYKTVFSIPQGSMRP